MSPDDPSTIGCDEPTCERAAAFWLYDPDADEWSPICEPHALEVHLSLEIGALLESGYLKPVEVGPPDGPPGEAPTARAAAFRDEVEALTGWSLDRS